jgi:hypothetical protein
MRIPHCIMTVTPFHKIHIHLFRHNFYTIFFAKMFSPGFEPQHTKRLKKQCVSQRSNRTATTALRWPALSLQLTPPK